MAAEVAEILQNIHCKGILLIKKCFEELNIEISSETIK